MHGSFKFATHYFIQHVSFDDVIGNTWSLSYTDPLKLHRVECIGTPYMGMTQEKDGGSTPLMYTLNCVKFHVLIFN